MKSSQPKVNQKHLGQTAIASDDDNLQIIETWRDKIIEQIMVIRDIGQTDMLDIRKVFILAISKDFYELADLLFMNTRGYSNFIQSGERSHLVKIEI